ncbi:MAG: MFS transporter [Christensenellaceae bacterium]|jgi:UMF1 family MFS transporter|nr:MFS transporter [Christensenellaceae bacterium]
MSESSNAPKGAGSKFSKREKSWILYDWANSVYATIMMAAVFNAFFTALVDDPRGGDYWWSIGTMISMLLVAVLAPLVGAFADYKSHKKKLFAFFLLLGLAATALCAILDDWRFLLAGYILSNIGFNGCNILYDSFLPDVTSPERMDTVSGWGYAMGYIGGSTVPFLMSIALIQFGGALGLGTAGAVKCSVLLTVLWWGLFSIPFLRNVRQESYVEKPREGVLRHTLQNAFTAGKAIVQNKPLFLFVLAYFFYIDGVGTIINLATSYGTQLGLGMLGMIFALLVTQLVAFPCSILFSRLAKKTGGLNMLTVAVSVYVLICVVGFFMGFLIEGAEIPAKLGALSSAGVIAPQGGNLSAINASLAAAGIEEGAWNLDPAYVLALSRSTLLFWVLALLVGTVQGGIQALSRSFFGKLTPPEKSGEYFGFFEIFGKFAAILGPMLYALTKAFTGRSSFSILSIVVLFVAALVILTTQRRFLPK